MYKRQILDRLYLEESRTDSAVVDQRVTLRGHVSTSDHVESRGPSRSDVTRPAAAVTRPGRGTELVLSLFPGVDLLGRGFEAEGFSVVRGPDTLLDSKIEDFKTPAGHLDGIIGGPPCQNYSDANRHRNPEEGDRLVLEYLRVIDEAQPEWFVMENVRNVPDVQIEGYQIQRIPITDAECGGKQSRLRHIQFGSRIGDIIRPLRTEGQRPVTPAVLCRMTSPNDRHSRRCDAQGVEYLPLKSLTRSARARVIGNGVPFSMARALAAAVRSRSVITDADCVCGCGRDAKSGGTHATASCRKRMQRRRDGKNRLLVYKRR